MSDQVHTRGLQLTGLVAALGAMLLLSASIAHAKTINITKSVGAPIPDATPPPPPPNLFPRPGVLLSTIDVGKLGKAKKIRDVNVTVQTAGLTGTEGTVDLVARLTAPNGAKTVLFSGLEGPGPPTTSTSIGPLTLDDEARLTVDGGRPDNPGSLFLPWAGSAAPRDPLAVMDNGSAQGTWTLRIHDQIPMQTSSLVSWRLTVVTGKPFQT